MRERATAWIDLAEKRRPAVVIEARGDLVRVAYGTSQAPADHVGTVAVHEHTRAGRKFPVREPTWFAGANTAWELPSALLPGAGDCARELYDSIRVLVEEHDGRVASDPG